MPNAITRIITFLSGQYVGMDELGNKYYQDRSGANNATASHRRRRWVVYKNKNDEASTVPPLYHSWLHYTSDDLPNDASIKKYSWMKDHQPNLTGTPDAYFPKGFKHANNGESVKSVHVASKARPPATGDYHAWQPEK